MVSDPAASQDASRYEGGVGRGETVLERPRPDYDPRGARLGSFRLFPSLTVSETFDDNVFRTGSNRDADLITQVAPRVQLRSDWNNHQLDFAAGADLGFYAFNPDENYKDYFAAVNGQLDVRRDSYLFGGASYSHLHESRGSPDDAGGDEPSEYELYHPHVGYFHRFNRLSVTTEGGFRRFDYHDVSNTVGGVPGEINNDDRDRKQYDVSARVGYEIVPEYEAFVAGSYNVVAYDAAVDDGGFDRDSDGYEAVAGVSIDFTGVLFGDVFAGYRSQSPEDARLGDISGPTFGADMTWNVTRLTTVTGGVRRSVEESTLGGASGYFATVYSVGVDHELLRNVILQGDASFEQDDFFGNGRDDDTIAAGAGVDYLMNRYVHLGLRYDYEWRDSNAGGGDYVDNRVMLSVRTQF